jgi:hypothetical protein
MRISMTFDDGKAITATLEHRATARDFASLLPLTLVLNDYHKTEKISDLSKRLTTADAPAAITPGHGRHHLLRALGQSGDFLPRLRQFTGLGQARHGGHGDRRIAWA